MRKTDTRREEDGEGGQSHREPRYKERQRQEVIMTQYEAKETKESKDTKNRIQRTIKLQRDLRVFTHST